MKAKSRSGQALYKKAKNLIPGGNQLLSKRPEMFLPDHWPAYYSRAKGVYVWDLAGKKYLDMSILGIGNCLLGYANAEIDRAVKKAIDRGVMATLNAPEEVELAELLIKLHPWAEMVRYARAGGEAMAMAVRIARAYTGRDTIAFCGYHGWSDWYLSANLADDKTLDGHLLPGLEPRGVPRGLKGTLIPFHFNDVAELAAAVEKGGADLAAIVLEPVKGKMPTPEFIKAVRLWADKTGAVLIADEITAGFKFAKGGSHLAYGLTPDIAVFSKAMANGYAMAAVIGRRSVMEAAQQTFISSTNWTERVGPVAALTTIKKLIKVDAASRLARIGRSVKAVWLRASQKYGVPITVGGSDAIASFSFAGPEAQAQKTLFVQEMLNQNILASNLFFGTLVHTAAHVKQYAAAVDRSFAIIAKALAAGSVQEQLKGPVAHSGFARLN
jgi:glutamate-1-semialdehyde 2,1-aminomutase